MTENFDPNYPGHDPFGEEAEGGLPPGRHGNRPAAGARQVSPGDVFAEGFLDLQSSESAGDFLGLDTDLVAGSGPGEGLDLEAPPGYGSIAPDPFAAPADPFGAEDDAFAGEPDPYAYESAEGDEDYDYGDLEGEFDFAEAESSGGRVGGMLAAAFVVGLLGVAAVYFGPKFLGDSGDAGPVEVARNPTPPGAGGTGTESASPTPGGDLGADPSPTGPGGSSTGTDVGVESFARGDVVPRPEDFSFEALTLPFTMDGARSRDTRTGAGLGGTRVTSTQTPGDTGTPHPGPLGSSPFDPLTSVQVDGVALDPRVFTTEQEWVGSDDLDMIWRGTSVPLQAVFSKARVHVPRVGAVRVFMDSGAVFEGTLLAVGQSRVWIDMEAGQVGLDGQRVTKVERLAHLGSGATAPPPEASGRRVRVVLPGGAIYGHVLSVQGDQVVVSTEDGGRITVTNARIEEVGKARAIVLQPPASWNDLEATDEQETAPEPAAPDASSAEPTSSDPVSTDPMPEQPMPEQPATDDTSGSQG